MTTLTDFLLARIAEDEARAAGIEGLWIDDRGRVLAECEAKRRIVDWVIGVKASSGRPPGFDPADAEALTHALLLLALPYADHDDYDEAWKP